jgi:hypothetical protein
MQLVAEHKLDLDAPVDEYLPPPLKTDIPRHPPIRIWNLMTHTAGFEDAVLSAHMFYGDPRNVPQLDVYLARYRPKRVRPPGIHADYSNYSVELLGAIVQHVSGEPFDDYIPEAPARSSRDAPHYVPRTVARRRPPRGLGGACRRFLYRLPIRDRRRLCAASPRIHLQRCARWCRFVEHFLPGARPVPAPRPPSGFARSGQVYAGTYLSERRNFSTIENTLSTHVATVTITPHGYLLVNGGKSGRFVELSSDIFREADNSDRIQFLRDAHGRVNGLAIADGSAVFDKAGLFENPRAALAALALLFPVCLCTLVGARGRRRWCSRAAAASQHQDVCLPGGALLAAACGWLLFLLLAIAAIVLMSAAGYKLLFHFPPPILSAVVAMGYIAAILTLTALWLLPRVWRTETWSLWRKVRHHLILALMGCVIVMLIEWKLLLAPLML